MFDERVEIISRTTGVSDIAVSDQIRSREIIRQTAIGLTLFVSDRSFMEVYAVEFRKSGDECANCGFLLGYNSILHKIPHHAYTNGAFVIPESVCAGCVIPSGSTLVDRPTLSDEIIVPDVAPTTDDRMVVINPPDEREIILISPVIVCGMVDDDFLDSFGLLDRPNEWMSIVRRYDINGSILLWKISV